MRVYECPCPECGAFTEILWRHIEFPEGQPEAAAFRCPHCQALIHESHKPEMVKRARWRATAPAVLGHAGFRLNALVSLLANASWGKLAAEFLRAKDGHRHLAGVREHGARRALKEQADEIDEAELLGRVEGFDLDHIPAEALAVTCGVDVQQDRLEISILGHSRDGTVFLLAHVTIWGSPHDDDTWVELDKLLQQRWRQPAWWLAQDGRCGDRCR